LRLVGLNSTRCFPFLLNLQVNRPGLEELDDLLDHRVAVQVARPPDWRARIEKELGKLLDRPVSVRFERSADEGPGGDDATRPGAPVTPAPNVRIRRPGDVDGDPMVQKVVQLFEARPVHMEVEEERETSG